jgi:type IV pilus assembly protein PilE
MKWISNGYTFIELVITLLVTTILALSAMITFQLPVIKSHQTTAKIDLLNLATTFEQQRENYSTYHSPSLTELGFHPLSTRYEFAIIPLSNGFKLKAIPKHYSKLDVCQTFSIDQDGNKEISGPGPPEACW